MKQAQDSDFEIHDCGAEVVIKFRPTESSYRFLRLAPSEWKDHGRVSSIPNVRHAKTSDTQGYLEADVAAFA